MARKKPIGILVFGILLILGSGLWLYAYSNLNAYKDMFGWLSESAIQARYLFSVINRLLLIVTGIGILCLKDVFRKIGIALYVLTICILPWKHPYALFENLARDTASQIINTMSSTPPPEVLRIIHRTSSLYALGATYFIDIAFAAIFILYFTRPQIKNYFKDNSGK